MISALRGKDMKRMIAITTALAMVAGGGAIAQHQGHGAHGSHGAPSARDSASTTAFKAANARMHKDMDIRYGGDADVDFVRGMIPHHQGAVEMAKIVLQHGKDPAIRKLAQEIVDAQEKEMTLMRGWLQAKGH
jgi:uncharacterized protein (DUF305 family)